MLIWQNARPICSVVFSQIKSPYSRLLEMDVLTLATVFLAALAGCVEGRTCFKEVTYLCCFPRLAQLYWETTTICDRTRHMPLEVVFVVVEFSDSHLLRDSKYWNYRDRVNMFIKFFVNLRTKSFLIFLSSTIFFKKRFTPHVFVYRTTSRKPTCLQAANAAKITAKYAAKSKTSIWSKYEYGEFIWKNTTEQNGLAFCQNNTD